MQKPYTGEVAPSGSLALEVVRGGIATDLGVVPEPARWPSKELSTAEIVTYGFPQYGLPESINRWRRSNLGNLWRGMRRVLTSRALRLPTMYGQLYLTVHRGDGSTEDLGLASMRVVTDAGVAYLTADMNAATGSSDISLFKFHGFGTGTTAEAANQTALVTELTTEYVTNSTRPTGSQANSTNTYTTVGTLIPDSGGTLAITEHGVFSANSSTTLWDRSKFAAVNLDSTAGDSLAATYVATFPSGS